MSEPVFVLDTHALIWFVKGYAHRLGLNALLAMLSPRARVVVPSYAFEEISVRFGPKLQLAKDPAIPPAALLRLVKKCSNVRVLDRGAALIAREIQLRSGQHQNGIDSQDIPIAAAVLVVRDYYRGTVVLVTSDHRLKRWASNIGITVVWNQRPVEWLPG